MAEFDLRQWTMAIGLLACIMLGSGAAAAPGDAPGPAEIATSADQPASFRVRIRRLIEQETRTTGLPADVAEAVVRVESSYNPATIGRVGEIGLMQVRPATAAMLGFRGSADELATPEINIHYGVIYLSKAWKLAEGDLCRALMKYRAGHGEEKMSPLSVTYCDRARLYLVQLDAPLPPPSTVARITLPADALQTPKAYATLKRGSLAASRAFWATHEARVQSIKSRLAAKWHRIASR